MKLKSLLLSAVVAAFIWGAASPANSQTDLDLPLASQAAQVKQRLGVTDVTITYHRPLVNGVTQTNTRLNRSGCSHAAVKTPSAPLDRPAMAWL